MWFILISKPRLRYRQREKKKQKTNSPASESVRKRPSKDTAKRESERGGRNVLEEEHDCVNFTRTN